MRPVPHAPLLLLPPPPPLMPPLAPGELAFDMSWPGVRVEVLEGLRLLADNVHALPVLKKALPPLACLITDPATKVGDRPQCVPHHRLHHQGRGGRPWQQAGVCRTSLAHTN